jgi:proteasome accessory factor C
VSTPSPTSERLRRLLLLVPWVARRQGIPVDELAEALGCTRAQLLADLDFMSLVGRPPFQPSELVDVYAEDDQVYVALDQRLAQPPRFTAAEAAALKAAALLISPAATDAVGSALQKLERALSARVQSEARAMGRVLDAAQAAPADAGLLGQAVRERREVALDYFSFQRGALEQRTVQPYELFTHRGHWYLAAHCHRAQEERLFRVDRVRRVELLDGHFQVPEGRKPASPPSPLGPGDVRVRFSPAVAPWVREQFGEGVRSLPDGGAEVELDVDNEAWLTGWVLSFGGEAELVAPAPLRRNIARAARASLE